MWGKWSIIIRFLNLLNVLALPREVSEGMADTLNWVKFWIDGHKYYAMEIDPGKGTVNHCNQEDFGGDTDTY